ncbi:hypothetical protein [Nocardioides jejuensis]|uniref:XRE family transcriptional regulator n=1 Tax=Nocardioides jejuensis TaxID=2502782 RepID=A0A4R1BYF8_9ACTN|nr:hypothetical protein [Nocardioides jejuensis]TCJ23051.1 hypothetical protein EPD65_11860 [Nocardioides jejuensis]
MTSIDPSSAAMGQAVRGALAQAGLTQDDSAPLLNMGLNSLSRRINGLLPFKWPELVQVSTLTGVPLLDLVTNAERIAAKAAA